jgi:UDP:flavonoid glycosyltransferase YjiC (YdhE family)
MLSIAAPAIEERRAGMTERIRTSPYLSLFPESLEDPQAPRPPVVHRFRDPAAGASSKPLPDWWPDDERPLVYVSFGSVAGTLPFAGALYAAAPLLLRTSIEDVLGDDAYRRAARRLADEMHALAPADGAVHVLAVG